MNDNFIEFWVACNPSGCYHTFKQKPFHNASLGMWDGEHEPKGQLALMHLESLGLKTPTITCDDEPVKLKISLAWEKK